MSNTCGRKHYYLEWLRAMLEHESHHRGQLYLMLTMIGVETPPLFGLTSEEVWQTLRKVEGVAVLYR